MKKGRDKKLLLNSWQQKRTGTNETKRNISESLANLFDCVSAGVYLLKFRIGIVEYLHRPGGDRVILSPQMLEKILLLLFAHIFLNKAILMHDAVEPLSLNRLAMSLIIAARVKLIFASWIQSLANVFHSIRHLFRIRAIHRLFLKGSRQTIRWHWMVLVAGMIVYLVVRFLLLFIIFLKIFHEKRLSLEK